MASDALDPMSRPTTEHDILKGAIEAIRREAALRLNVVELDVKKGGKRIDAILQMPGRGVKLVAEVKKWANHTNLGVIINQIQQVAAPSKGLLVADYINPNMAEGLKEAGVQFIDTTGNAYINQPPTFIYIKGIRPEAQTVTRTKAGKAFHPTGMKIVFAFLTDRELINAPYRKIAEQAQVALGTVGDVVHDLTAQDFLVEDVNGAQRQLAEFDLLLNKWVEAYPHKLREKQHLGTFTTANANWWQTIKPERFGAAWGGEIAAAEYTKYLNPKDAVVYIRKADMPVFLKEARLKKIQANEPHNVKIELMEPFWKQGNGAGQRGLVHPIIVYADLVATGDPRNLDTANKIREQYIR
jgi:hypothetical protein